MGDENGKRQIWLFLIISFFLIGLTVGFFGGSFYATSQVQKSFQTTIDEYFQTQYNTTIQVRGEEAIESMVDEANKYDNSIEKINIIADLVSQDFNEPFFNESKFFHDVPLCGHYDYRYFGYPYYCSGYGFDKDGRVRANGVSLNHNVYWVAYQKTGACQELAELFANVSTTAGIPSRVICNDGLDHQWNEVYLSSEWKVFDITRYYDAKSQNISNPNFWLMNQSEYLPLWSGKKVSSVFVCNENKSSINLNKEYGLIRDIERSGYDDQSESIINAHFDNTLQLPRGMHFTIDKSELKRSPQ